MTSGFLLYNFPMSEDLLIPSVIALLAAIFAAFAFLRRRGWLGAAPAQGSRFREFGENIRLRDLFRLAVLMEEAGRDFYLKMSEKASDVKTKELCSILAEEESRHWLLLLNKLSRWHTLDVNRLTWPAFLERVKREGFFENAPADNASEDQLAAYAIRQEAKSAEFYQLFEPAFPEAWKRVRLHDLVLEERSHEARLRAAYPHLNNNSD